MRFILTLVLAALPLASQHDMSTMTDAHMKNMPGMKHDGDSQKAMEASGTSVNPASSPMEMIHLDTHRWTLMFHGAAFVTDIQQTGPRGGDKFASMSWFMAEGEHPLGGGTFAIRTMFSLDAATDLQREYPEL